LNPDNADAWYNMGVTLHNLGRYNEAMEAYDKVLEVNPDNTVYLINKGLALGYVGRREEGNEIIHKIIPPMKYRKKK
jgi:lipoprotein NlpI